jgi:hypothetical protein
MGASYGDAGALQQQQQQQQLLQGPAWPRHGSTGTPGSIGCDAAASCGSASSPPQQLQGARGGQRVSAQTQHDSRARKDAYRAELEAQIQERSARKAAEKGARAAEDAAKDKEMAAYSPWGRGGAGAPLRDAAGQVRPRGAGGWVRKACARLQQAGVV